MSDSNILNMTWILDRQTKEPIHPVSMEQLNDCFNEQNVRVASKHLNDDVYVSTVLLMYSPDLRGRAMFETMIFGMGGDDYQERCWTYAQALSQHNEAVKVAEKFLKMI